MALVPEIVFVLGPPGAGKGTQCSKIVQEFGYIHLSAGDLLRAERESGSPDGDLIQDYIKNGKIVPIEITIRLLERAIFSQGASKVLIDGFPRNKENLDGWEKAMVETGKTRTKFMLFYECSEEECFKRAMGRMQNRVDDNAESFKKRITTYLESTMEVINEFDGRGMLRRINANPSPDEVFDDTQKLFLVEGDAPSMEGLLGGVAPSVQAPKLPLPQETPASEQEGDLMRAEEDVKASLSKEHLQTESEQPSVTKEQPSTTIEQPPITTEQPSQETKVPSSAPLPVSRVEQTPLSIYGYPGAELPAGQSPPHHQGQAVVLTLGEESEQQAPGGAGTRMLGNQISGEKATVVFVLGPPGAGKGTQCSKIVEKFGYTHLSAGDLLREERKSGSPDGDLIESHITGGTIVPVAITVKLLANAMNKIPGGKFLIDGFPRNEDNVQGWNKVMEDKVNLKCVLFYECPEDECLKRALGRNEGRSDDNVESFRKRIRTYIDSTLPIVNSFKARGLLRTIDSTPDPVTVFLETEKCFKS